MGKNLYIDASHPSETRVVLKSENNIEDYEYESVNSTLIKNIFTQEKLVGLNLPYKQLLLILEESDTDFCHLMIYNLTTINFLIVIQKKLKKKKKQLEKNF